MGIGKLWRAEQPMVTSQIKRKGFSLVELMIAIVIIAVLMAFAYPNYQGYIQNTNQARVKVQLQNMAINIETQTLNYKKVTNVPINKIGFNGVDTGNQHLVLFPASDALYQIRIEPVSSQGKIGSDSWEVIATPIEGVSTINQAVVSIDYRGVVCITDDSKKECHP